MKIYITTCDKKLSYANKIKEMFENSPYEYYFVYGKNNKNKISPYLEFDFEETYDNLPEKTYNIIEHFLTTGDDKLIKIDDDTILNIDELKVCENYKEDYVGCFVNDGILGNEDEQDKYFDWYKTKQSNYKKLKKDHPIQYVEGGFYILSKSACHEIIKYKNKFCNLITDTYISEDTLVGICLMSNKFLKKNIRISKNLSYDVSENLLSIHPVNLLLFDKLKNTKTTEEKLNLLSEHNFYNKYHLEK